MVVAPVDRVSFRAAAAPRREPADEILYFPMTDRFCNGDRSNDHRVDAGDPRAFHGGDLKGLTEKLDYIASLGMTTIWLSPLQDNVDRGYHGYWIRDHHGVEEHQGTREDVRRLVDEAHKRGLKVVLDVVVNHVAPDHPWVDDPARHGWFHHQGPIKDWEDPHQMVYGDLAGLPDLAHENPAVYEFLLENTADWVKEFGFDGVRLDAVKHVQLEFWERFLPDLKARVGRDLLVIGEVLHGDPAVLARYQRAGVEHLFDMPLQFTIRDVFAHGHSMRRLGDRFAQDSLYLDPHKLVTHFDNHDFSRFMHEAGGDKSRLKLALAFLMAARGIPSVYYGTEVGMDGGHDPHNRRMMEFGKDPELQKYFTGLTSLRHELAPLRRGNQLEMWQDDQVYAFARQHEGREVVAVFNNSEGSEQRRVPLRAETHLKEGAVLKDRLSGRTVRVQDGHLQFDLAPRTAMILEDLSS